MLISKNQLNLKMMVTCRVWKLKDFSMFPGKNIKNLEYCLPKIEYCLSKTGYVFGHNYDICLNHKKLRRNWQISVTDPLFPTDPFCRTIH